MSKIIINGVDGNLGKQVVTDITNLIPKEHVILTAPSKEPLQQYQKLGFKTAVVDFTYTETLDPVFKDADKVLLISMPFVGKKRRQAHKNVIDTCVRANVKQIIYTSVLSSANPLNPSVENIDHGYTETLIQNSPLDYIILRNSLFAEAFISDYLRAVDNHEAAINKNMGTGRVWFISRKDAALAIAFALNNTLLHREVLNINGITPYSYQDFLNIANKVTGANIKYKQITDQELYQYFDSIHVPRTTDGDFSKSPIQATSEGMVSFGTTVREGFLDVPVSDFVQLTGHQPITMKYMFEHQDEFLLGERHTTEK
ncbi:NAD(P)H-binding protein [Limosilactobacillus sp. c9Ua_26_M]|uniref:NAD(P)H-binding protein n=1 Tax=Limosilactobacillus urinaemulieris TaxID=2742600 RepID=A0ABR8ZI92_9LACO|nr:NAD(P)H-binding protein [Limosilactobacillus urinaemulieris]MBD8084794.1 NAD(P)H-binding protein [Limosilactobacillus urinaemulieris]